MLILILITQMAAIALGLHDDGCIDAGTLFEVEGRTDAYNLVKHHIVFGSMVVLDLVYLEPRRPQCFLSPQSRVCVY